MGAAGNNNPNYPSGISYDQRNGECSFAHAVLQTLYFHPMMKNDINNNSVNEIMNGDRYPITKEIFKMFISMRNGERTYSYDFFEVFIKTFNQSKAAFGPDNQFLRKDPYHFLFFLLHFLQLELNFSPRTFDINRLNNLMLGEKRDKRNIFELYNNFMIQNHSYSIIFKNFFNSEENEYTCQNCGTYFDFDLNNIFTMDISNINLNPGNTINLDECFNSYCNPNNMRCQYCYNRVLLNKKIYHGNTIIIGFKRKKLGNRNDIDFPIRLNISKYSGVTEGRVLYVLKSCISFMPMNNNPGVYFTDINLNLNSNTGKWIRYYNDTVYELQNFNAIYNYEPQLLIYQLEDLEQNNHPNPPNTQNLNNINNYQSHYDFNTIQEMLRNINQSNQNNQNNNNPQNGNNNILFFNMNNRNRNNQVNNQNMNNFDMNNSNPNGNNFMNNNNNNNIGGNNNNQNFNIGQNHPINNLNLNHINNSLNYIGNNQQNNFQNIGQLNNSDQRQFV